GHGGQILLSAASAELLRGALAAGALPGADLRDLGARRLKDLRQIEHIYQLAAPDLPDAFPPLLTIDARPTNLPAAPTALLGREREVAEAGALLRQQDVRLLTLTGPGGTGKTRLSMQLGAELLDEFEHGVFFVALAPITDPALVPATIAQALALQEGAGAAPLAALQSFLRERELLLVLDNFEQILAAAPLLAELLAAAPRLKLLVSSRAVLRLYGEHEFAVPPLDLPAGDELAVERIARSPAVQLFARRARAARPDFALSEANAAAVAGICQRLDGLPLAIELAAARSRLFTPEVMLGRLGSRLQLLTGGPRDLPARQQTLRGAIDWGYRLLSADEQRLLARLAVFAGGWTLEAAERVGGDAPESVLDGLGALADNSLIRQAEADGETRYQMLETIREYALEQLEASGEAPAARDAHLAWFVASTEAAAAELAETVSEPMLRALARELDNLRAALGHGLADQPAAAARLAAALRLFWELRGHWREGFDWIEAALAANPAGAAEAALRARLLEAGGLLANFLNRFEQARTYCAESLAIRRGLGDPVALAQSLYSLGEALHNLGRYAEAMALWEESLAVYRSIDHGAGAAWTLFQICWEWLYLGDSQRAVEVAGEMVALRRQLPDQRMMPWYVGHAASILTVHGDYAGALALAEEAEALFARLEDLSGLGYAGALRGRIFQLQGRYAEALPLLERHVSIARRLERSQRVAGALLELACLLAEAPAGAAEIERALEALAESAAILRRLD
ncbi:MAG TPA: tetratricopeptide repeat protein, partial [Herpetosiphonaceae bacterium]